MPTFGHIDNFDCKEDINSYIERVDQYFIANALVPVPGHDQHAAQVTKQAAIFLTSVGKLAYGVIQNLTKPKLPKDSNYKELCDILIGHYAPTRLEVAETFKFHTNGVQKESVSAYISKLRGLASTCNFGTHLQRALRDQFVAGCANSETQQKLLQEERTFEACCKLALADEAAMREYKELHGSTSVNQLKSFSKKHRHSAPTAHNSGGSSKRHPGSTGGASSSGFTESSAKKFTCYSCGKSGHLRPSCKFRGATCTICKRVGHISTVCKSKDINMVDDEEEENDINELFYMPIFNDNKNDSMYAMSNTNSKHGINITLNVQNTNVNMLLDTGCSLSVIPFSMFKNLKGNAVLKPTTIRLTTFTGEQIVPMGQAEVLVNYNKQFLRLPLLVLKQGIQPLLGRNWLKVIKINWETVQQSINVLHAPSSNAHCIPLPVSPDMSNILDKYSSLFDSNLGCYTGGEPVRLNVTETPRFHKARPVPYSLLPKVGKALLTMKESGILKPVNSAPCAAPIVPVLKKSGDLRICGDFSLTFNQCGMPSKYPLPRLEDLVSSFRGCTVFSQLDMSQAYHQVPIHDESQQWLTINTHMGLFMFTRLPNGIHSAPAEFQMIMDKTLAGLENVVCYIDDILIGGKDIDSHDKNVCLVFERLSSAGFKLNKAKCSFQKKSVQYLGHIIDSEGLHPTQDKINAVKNAPPPTNVTQLKSFLGLIMFYSRFLNNHSTILAPLNKLLRKNATFIWTKVENNAFISAKKLLLESNTLVHYNESLPLYLACDASSYGIGIVLSHSIAGEERPISFASSTLTPAQQNYSQLDKEALSIIYGLKHFHQYLYGRKFTILCDNKPLIHLFTPSAPVPVQAAARLQRWSLILASYDYTIQYRATAKHSNADGMSRLPLRQYWSPPEENINCIFFTDDICTNITSEIVSKYTQSDKILSKVFKYLKFGWPTDDHDKDLVFYRSKCNELSVDDNLILWNTRVVIPEILQKSVLNELHDTHPGITRMRMLARSYVWWPSIDDCIAKLVSNCSLCQSMRNDPAKSYVHPWVYPTHAWSRVHIDFAGPISGSMYFVVVDAYSKYPEVVKMNNISSTCTITALRQIFSRFGIPDTLVSDNGPQFVSQEFHKFCTENGIHHVTSAVYKPSTNGQAERVVQILKSAVKQSNLSGEPLHVLLPRFLLRYRITPHSTTGKSPSMLFFGRQLRTKLDLVFPSLRSKVEHKQQALINKTLPKGCRSFEVGDSILFRNYGKGEKWFRGFVIEKLGQRHYLVHCVQSGTVKRHIDQIIKRSNVLAHDVICEPVDSNPDINTPDPAIDTPVYIDNKHDSNIDNSVIPDPDITTDSSIAIPDSLSDPVGPCPIENPATVDNPTVPTVDNPTVPDTSGIPSTSGNINPPQIRKSTRLSKSTKSTKYKDFET